MSIAPPASSLDLSDLDLDDLGAGVRPADDDLTALSLTRGVTVASCSVATCNASVCDCGCTACGIPTED